MIPVIIFEKIEQGNNIIYFGEEASQFDVIPLSKDELTFIHAQFEKKVYQIVINRYKYQVIIVLLKEDKEGFNSENIRRSGYNVLGLLSAYQIENVDIVYTGKYNTLLHAFIEGIFLGNYQFNKYKKASEEKNVLKQIKINITGPRQKEIEEMVNLSKAVHFARDLVNEPVIYLNASKLAEEIKKIAKDTGIKVEVFEKKKIESLRMGGLLAVNKGSLDPPTFSIMEWKPDNAINHKPFVFIGKGLVFDTGGLSLKPTHDSMDEMKCDMAGAAAVIGAIWAIAKNQIPVYVVGLVPSTDNRPGGNAYAPGDIITMHNGSTVEILNTDAEGRIILADALSFSENYDPELVVTIATLTGSAQMAIGQNAIVMMGNADEKQKKNIQKAGNEVHERLVEFPFWDEYAEELKSDVADMKNIGGKMAGAIIAGKFLEKFTKHPFIHLDIAGPAFLKKNVSYRPKGGTGIAVRLLYQYIKNMIN